MRNFYLIVNREKPRVEEAAGLICSFFAEQGCRCIRLDRHDGLRRDAEVAAAYRYTDRRTVRSGASHDGHQYGASGVSDADRA